MKPHNHQQFISRLLLLAGLALAPTARAAAYTWNQTGAAATWNVDGNWTTPGFPNAAGDVANVNTTLTAAQAITLGQSNITLGILNIGDATSAFVYTLGADPSTQTLTFNNSGGGAQINFTGKAATIGAPIVLSENLTIANATSAGGGNIRGGITGTGNVTISNTTGGINAGAKIWNFVGMLTNDSTSSSTITIQNQIGPNVTSIIQNGQGVMAFGGGNNPFAGQVQILNGAVRLQADGALNSANTTVSIASGKILNLNTSTAIKIGGLQDNTAGDAGQVTRDNPATGTLTLAGSGTYSYSGKITNASGTTSLVVALTGAGKQTFNGTGGSALTYTGTTQVNSGTLLINGSHTGAGGYSVSGGTLGGNGSIATAGASGITVASGGFLAPGASIGTLTLNLGSTTGTVGMTGGGDFKFELGTANVSIGTIGAGSSDLLVISSASAGDVAFGGGNDIDILGTATGEGFYKLFDTSAGVTTWTGLTLGGATAGGNLITGGLTVSNLGGSFSGDLILADGSAGTSAGDIYLHVVPEPSTYEMLFASLGILLLRSRIRARKYAAGQS
jgi:autotransporter-associated beta strand protein